MLRILFDQFEEVVFLSALWIGNLHTMLGLLAEDLFEDLALFEVNRRVDATRKIRSIEVELLQQGRKKLRGVELFLVFPVKVSPVHHAPAANVKQIHGHLRR